ncbi:MAG: hypothetical protein JNK25_14420 [Phycisphaerae bacterium]|nr:hypothetical protein [Phycisphaerae bacterium]
MISALDSSLELLEPRVHLAGTTLITHGYQPNVLFSIASSWVGSMARAVAMVGGQAENTLLDLLVDSDASVTRFRHEETPGTLRSRPNAELVGTIDWADASNNFTSLFEPTVRTNQVGASVARVLEDSVVGALPLQLPLHLIGHSRGASVMNELARGLGERGIWVDHLTFLDPHPLVLGDTFVTADEVDPEILIPSNVIFTDSYYQLSNESTWFGFVRGTLVAGTARLRLDGMPSNAAIDHSETHAYYHGTIDLAANSDGNISIRPEWYSTPSFPGRTESGFALSRLRGGFTNSAWARSGLHVAFGGEAVERTSIPSYGPQWPNVADVRVSGPLSYVVGEKITTTFLFGDRDSSASVRIFLDDNQNPFDGFSESGSLMMQRADIASGEVAISSSAFAPGTYYVGAVADDGERRRYSYFQTPITLIAPPSTGGYKLYFPEGFRSDSINEYIPLVNPNPSPVSYHIFARYETGDRDQIIASGILPAASRGGITTTELGRPNEALVREGVGYAIEIWSDQPIGASMSHYDFGVATGEAFTDTLSAIWSFPSVEKVPSRVSDFITWFNPTNSNAVVSVTATTEDGREYRGSWATDALRRGGISINDVGQFPEGRFSFRIEATEVIVASLSHYDRVSGQGFISLGVPTTASKSVAIPWSEATAELWNELQVSNLSVLENEIQYFTFDESGASTPTLYSAFIPPGGTLRLSANQLGLSQGGRGWIAVMGNFPVSAAFASTHHLRGDALGLPALTSGSTKWYFADAFMNRWDAGRLFFEHLTLVNIAPIAADVSVTYYWGEGNPTTEVYRVDSARSRTIALHENLNVLNKANSRGGSVWFGVGIESSTEIGAALTHWDLSQRGGWSTWGTKRR